MIREIVQGALAGLAATAPMTGVMKIAHRCLPWYERYPLPPRQITMNVADATGVHKHLNEHQKTGLTVLAHVGYGAAMGAAYGLLIRQNNGAKAGMVFGLGVWAGSYLGLLPALGVLKPATEHPARRNAMMIAAHLVWGLSLTWILNAVQRNRRPKS